MTHYWQKEWKGFIRSGDMLIGFNTEFYDFGRSFPTTWQYEPKMLFCNSKDFAYVLAV